MSRHLRYSLDPEGNPVPCTDGMEWARGNDNIEARRVAHTTLSDRTTISTVFLGLNHQYGEGPPLLFETLVQGPIETEAVFRYSTWADALQGHRDTVYRLLHQSHGIFATKVDERERPTPKPKLTVWDRLSGKDVF